MTHSSDLFGASLAANQECVTSGSIGGERSNAPNRCTVATAPLRTRELKILSFVANYISTKGFVPTMKELQSCCGHPNRTLILRSLEKLRRHGLIKIEGQSIRTIRLCKGAIVMVGQPNGETKNV